MRLNWTRVILVSITALVLIAIVAIQCFRNVTSVPRGLDDYVVYVPSNVPFDTVVNRLVEQGIVTNELTFRTLAEQMNYAKDTMRSGRFEVKPGWPVEELIRHLRNGEQSTTRLTISTGRFAEDVARRASQVLEPDSAAFARLFKDEDYLRSINFTPEEFLTIFIPNTYDFFWNVSPKGFVDRMIKENKRFWGQNDRLAKAKKLGLTPREVYTLASIVEQESNQNDERPIIAGLYLNRIRKKMRLEADPTVVYANLDFGTRRVLNRDLKVDSPYNTYRVRGLPPGPISLASISSIDAVLNEKKHDYIFMCSKGDGSGYHNFAKTLAGHNQNRIIYDRNLRARGLR